MNEIPFTSETKRMTTLHETPDGASVAYAKGAPEVILASCTRQLASRRRDGARRRRAAKRPGAAQQLAGEALRVLAVASQADATLENAEHEHDVPRAGRA